MITLKLIIILENCINNKNENKKFFFLEKYKKLKMWNLYCPVCNTATLPNYGGYCRGHFVQQKFVQLLDLNNFEHIKLII